MRDGGNCHVQVPGMSLYFSSLLDNYNAGSSYCTFNSNFPGIFCRISLTYRAYSGRRRRCFQDRYQKQAGTSPLPLKFNNSSFLVFFQRLYHVDEFLTLKIADELQLESGEDAPMSMAAHPDVHPFCKGPPSAITCLCSPRRDLRLCVESTALQKWSRKAII